MTFSFSDFIKKMLYLGFGAISFFLSVNLFLNFSPEFVDKIIFLGISAGFELTKLISLNQIKNIYFTKKKISGIYSIAYILTLFFSIAGSYGEMRITIENYFGEGVKSNKPEIQYISNQISALEKLKEYNLKQLERDNLSINSRNIFENKIKEIDKEIETLFTKKREMETDTNVISDMIALIAVDFKLPELTVRKFFLLFVVIVLEFFLIVLAPTSKQYIQGDKQLDKKTLKNKKRNNNKNKQSNNSNSTLTPNYYWEQHSDTESTNISDEQQTLSKVEDIVLQETEETEIVEEIKETEVIKQQEQEEVQEVQEVQEEDTKIFLENNLEEKQKVENTRITEQNENIAIDNNTNNTNNTSNTSNKNEYNDVLKKFLDLLYESYPKISMNTLYYTNKLNVSFDLISNFLQELERLVINGRRVIRYERNLNSWIIQAPKDSVFYFLRKK